MMEEESSSGRRRSGARSGLTEDESDVRSSVVGEDRFRSDSFYFANEVEQLEMNNHEEALIEHYKAILLLLMEQVLVNSTPTRNQLPATSYLNDLSLASVIS